ncbi:PREDICTED: uncharacterized protein LOC105456547 [Wasmannia auropunctata]|uniref:uncharacterized protein LOC105456547 n=1 Tax=Wasmannia auropunctata TaxID=64793 RepID=UPI0005EDF5F3|nr:PREDICTED: uncharacterized protein LOC105456547 [Wasmannia auropunctata]
MTVRQKIYMDYKDEEGREASGKFKPSGEMIDSTKKITSCNCDVALRTNIKPAELGVYLSAIIRRRYYKYLIGNNCFKSRITQRIVNIARYYDWTTVVRVNKILLLAIGQWPYQSSRTSHAIVIVIVTIFSTQFLTKLCGIISYIHDMDIVIECLVPIMVDLSGISKIMNSILYVNEIRTLLDRIRDDFYSLRKSNDVEILEKYADNGKKSSNIYICVMFILTIVFMLMPFQPLILQVANATTRPLLHKVEYYVDMDKYYFPILIHGYLTVVICVTSIVAADALFVIFVQHACGLFIVTGSRIEQAIQEVYLTGDVNPPIKDTTYRNIIQCVHNHKTAIRFANLMEMAYSKHFLFQTGLNMILISVTGVGAVTKSDDLSEFLRLVAVSCALLFHLCFECINAQRLMDYSGYLHTNLINLNWYDASPRTKKLVLFMMMKTQPPCVLTAGGMFVMCMQTFATMLMCLIGQWPYQEWWEKFLIQFVFVPAVFSQAILQGGGMITAYFADDIDAFMESSSPFVISLMCVCKHINYTYNHEQMKKLAFSMVDDWNIYSKLSHEYDILCRNYEMGRKVTIAYAVSLYGSMTPFLVVPVVLNTASYMGLYNISEGRPLMFRTEYFVDSEKYYYPLLVHSYIGTLGFVSIVVAIDSMLVFHVQHECGMCEILGYRLARIIDADTLDINLYEPSKQEAMSYRYIKDCVIMHNHIIEYARRIEKANTTSYFFQLGFNMMGMTFTIFQAVVKLSDPNEALRYASFTCCLLSVLFLESWPGQQLSDYTDKIFAYTTSGLWYQSSLRVRKMISIMLFRSYVPIKITAGKLYTLNLANFASVVRTSFSYFTVLCSMH